MTNLLPRTVRFLLGACLVAAAFAMCFAIALAERGSVLGTFRGSVEGRILDAPRGTGGFGYDPLFYPEGFGQTFGEAPLGDKMPVSHRAQALEKMFAFINGHVSEL